MRRRTAIMGILNVTPDSFSDGGLYVEIDRAVARGNELARDGADIIDIGGESTRPGSSPVTEEEECRRILPVIRELRRTVPIPISVDTYKSGVARRALEAGADVVNDISALRFDPEMVSLVAGEGVPVILMHMQGTPRIMQEKPSYGNVLEEVRNFLQERAEFCIRAGIRRELILLDPGIGFGKELEHNLALLRGLSVLSSLGHPLLVGASRKTFIGRILGLGPKDRLEGSLAVAVSAVFGGANVIRAHDVKESRRAIAVADALRYGTGKVKESGSA